MLYLYRLPVAGLRLDNVFGSKGQAGAAGGTLGLEAGGDCCGGFGRGVSRWWWIYIFFEKNLEGFLMCFGGKQEDVGESLYPHRM